MARLWGILVIAAVLISGCSAQQGEQSTGSGTNPPTPPPATAGGSLVLGGGASEACADGSAAHAFTFGVPVTNRSDAQVQLVSAEFEHIAGVELIGTWVVGPAVGEDDPDASSSWTADYPPTGTSGQGWDDRTAIGDSTIPAHGSTWIAFAIQLSEGSTVGKVATLTLDYVDAAGTGAVVDQGTYGIGENDGGTVSCAL